MNNLGILDAINSIKRAPAVAYLATSDLRARYKILFGANLGYLDNFIRGSCPWFCLESDL